VAFFTIQTTTPYNLLWLDYGKYFSKSQALFHPRRGSPSKGFKEPRVEEQRRKIAVGRGTNRMTGKDAEKAGHKELPQESILCAHMELPMNESGRP